MKLSETDSILIGEFSNAAGDSVFDGTLREALGVSLAQSPSLNLVPVEKVREALRSMGRPADSLLLQELAPSLCQRLGATVYLTGSIVKAGSGYSLRLDAVRCSTDDSGISTKSDAASRGEADRKSTRLNSSHLVISYAVFCLKKKNHKDTSNRHMYSTGDTEAIRRQSPTRKCPPPPFHDNDPPLPRLLPHATASQDFT